MNTSFQRNSSICPRCNAENVLQARFCRNCGYSLGATLVQGRTLVMNPSAPLRSGTTRLITPDANSHTTLAGNRAFVNPSQSQLELTVFVQDVSGSMNEEYDARFNKLDAAKRATCSTILQKSRLDANDEIGVVAFDDEAREIVPLLPLNTNKQRIIQAVQSLVIEGGTDINAGLKAAVAMLAWERQNVVRRIILQTDGHGGHPLHTAEDAKERGVVIDVIGVGESPDGVNEKLLRKVASVIQGETRYRFIKNSQTLVNYYTQLAGKTKTC